MYNNVLSNRRIILVVAIALHKHFDIHTHYCYNSNSFITAIAVIKVCYIGRFWKLKKMVNVRQCVNSNFII